MNNELLIKISKFAEEMTKRRDNGECYGISIGRKYIKVGELRGKKLSCAEAFIDFEGNIFKAASWNKPADHVRGNLFSEQNGFESMGYDGFINYLRGG